MTTRKPLQILLDANFLMLPIRFGLDYKAEIERIIETSFILITTPAVLEELKHLKKIVKVSERKQINFALTMAEDITTINEILAPGENVDDQLIRIAQREGCVVATTDRELRKRLRRVGVPVIFLRQTSHLIFEGLLKCSSSN